MSSVQQQSRPSSSSLQQRQQQQQQQLSSAKKPGLMLPPHSPPCRLLSSEAYRGKIDWEAKHRKPCPYARPAGEGCPYVRRSTTRACVSEQIIGHGDRDDAAQPRPEEGSLSRGLLVSVPGAPHRDFGSGFSREIIHDPESSPQTEREPDGTGDGTGGAAAATGGATAAGSVRREAAAAAAPAPAASPKRRRSDKKNGARNNNKKSGVGRGRVPTLLKIHQRVIEDALLELTRSREKAFENLGERLGRQHEDFTFYDGTFNFAAGLPTQLPAHAVQRRKFARSRRKLHQRMRSQQPTTVKGARHRAQTEHAYRGTALPRFKKDQESWKIPLLRVPTPTNGEHQEATSTFGSIVRLGSHPQHSSSAAAASAVQPQNYPGRHSASCPPRKLRKDASGGRKHPRTVEGSGRRGRDGGGGGRSDSENEPSERELPDVRPAGTTPTPATEIVEESDQQRSLLETTALDEASGQGQHEESCGTTDAAEIAASCVESSGPRDTTQSTDRAIAAGATAEATDAHAETVAWSGGAPPPAVEMPGSVRVRAEKCVDEIVSQGMLTHLAAVSSGEVSTAGSRLLPTSAEANNVRSAAAVAIAPSEKSDSAEQYVDEVLSQYLRTQPISDLTIGIARPRPEAVGDEGPERCDAVQGNDAAVASAVQPEAMEGKCVGNEISEANQILEVAGNNTQRSCAAATEDAEDGIVGLDFGVAGSGHLNAEAKLFVEEVVSDALQAHLRTVFGDQVRRPSPATGVERDCARSKLTTTTAEVQPSVFEQVVNDAVRYSLHAAVVAALGEQQCSESTADAGLDEPPTRLAEEFGEPSKGGAKAVTQPNASDEEKIISGETATRTPTTMSSNSSSYEFSLNREPSVDIVPHLDENSAHDDNATAPVPTLSSPGHRLDGADAPVEVANSAKETLASFATSAASEGIGLTPLHDTKLGGEERREEPNAHPGLAQKGRPVGFLEDIVAGRASLKPAETSRSASAKPTPLELRLQKESMEAEAKQRAAVLCEFEDLVRTERLDRYAPGSFSRGAVHGEGKQSVVYCADVISLADDARQRGGGEQDPHLAGGVVVGGGVIAAATAAMADIVTTAAVGAIMATTTTTTTTATTTTTSDAAAAEPASKTLAAGVVISVMAASVSSVAASRISREHDTRLPTSFAAKEFRYNRQDAPVSILRDARREVCAHLRVAGCAHVVALRGVWLTPRVTLLLEPMDVGNLHDFIRHSHHGETRRGTDVAVGHVGGGLTPAGAVYLLADVADGIAALHDAGVVHRDVKSHNVMMVRRQLHPPVDDGDNDGELVGRSNMCAKEIEKSCSGTGKSEWEAKLGDLGSAALVPPEGRAALTEEAGTSGWVAPEVFGDEGYGTAADIFSLGVLIWETLTQGALDNPLSGLSGQTCRTKLREGLRPPWPPQAAVADGVKELVERCWAFEAGERPRASAVADELRALAAAAAAADDVAGAAAGAAVAAAATGGAGAGAAAQPLASI